MRVRWRPQTTIQARSLNPAIITTGGLKNCREVIGEYTAKIGTAALHFGAEIAPKKKNPRQVCGCRDIKWRPRRSRKPATAVALDPLKSAKDSDTFATNDESNSTEHQRIQCRAVPSCNNPGPKLRYCHNSNLRSQKVKRSV
ncbi:hypothetical protein NDU88_009002 [Pleurodeles waltl]|uniref:Uncharacterized protein n=1 Tax=Pleurodeles waltl TaxID=8319 RepID=A0AAV7RWF0_PLEWA|nr:hypothetical protein NDU88_009002 [Pleurodeles waltl]